jgi:hypothetical protein
MKVTLSSSVDLFHTGVHGLEKAETQASAAAQKIATGEVEATHIVDLKTVASAHKVNAAVLGVADRMHDQLLDILV